MAFQAPDMIANYLHSWLQRMSHALTIEEPNSPSSTLLSMANACPFFISNLYPSLLPPIDNATFSGNSGTLSNIA